MNARCLAYLLFIFFAMHARSVYAQTDTYKGCTEIEQVVEEECIALERLYENTFGEDWFEQTGWLRANQPCTWFGVTCNSKEWPRNVIKIELIDNNVGGSLPGELGNLPFLEELIIENRSQRGGIKQLSDILPSTLGAARSLRVIKLGQNQIRGAVPQEFGRLKNLEEFDLHDNLLDGFLPDSLGNLKKLSILDFSDNRLRGNIPSTWGEMDSLKVLNLSNNLLNGRLPESLGNLERLLNLRLNDNDFTGNIPRSFAKLTNLSWLILDNNDLSGMVLPDVLNLSPQLVSCTLENNRPDLCIPDRPAYRQFGSDSLCGVPLSNSCSACANVTGINQGACQGLETLYLETQGYAWNNKEYWLASDSPCEWFGVGCENDTVVSLNLSDNNLAGQLPDALGNLTGLENLDLSNNLLTGPLPLAVAQVAAQTNTCTLTNNTDSFCIPDEDSFAALGKNPLCQLPLSNACKMPEEALLSDVTATAVNGAIEISVLAAGISAGSSWALQKKHLDKYETVQVEENIQENQGGEYLLRLEQVVSGIHVYRIRVQEPGGRIILSDDIEVLADIPAGFFTGQPFPNPAQSTAFIQLTTDQDQEITVALFNAIGQQINILYEDTLTANQHETLAIQTDNLASGLYFVRVTGNGIALSRSLVLMK